MRFRLRNVVVCSPLGFLLLFFSSCASYNSQQVAASPSQGSSLSLSASSLNFNGVVVGQTGSLTLQLTNSGSAPLQIRALSLSNRNFSFTGPSLPRALPPSNSLSYTFTFAPTSPGNSTATFNISSNASSAPTSVSLAGRGEKSGPSLTVTPASVNFGDQKLQSTRTQNVTLQNTGNVPLTLQGVFVAGGAFGFSNLAPGVALAPSQQVTFQVWFKPSATGPASATVSFLNSSLSSPEKLNLSGEGGASTTSTLSPSGKHKVHLVWHPATGDQVIGYIVYRSDASSDSFSPLFGTAIREVSYEDDTVAAGDTYHYVVTSVDASGVESPHSNQVTVVVP